LQYPEIQQRENKRLLSAREAWNKYWGAYSNLQEQLQAANGEISDLQEQLQAANGEISNLQEQLQAASEDNQPSLNNSSEKQVLQEISSNTQCLPEFFQAFQTTVTTSKDLLSILQQINENLVSQSLSKTQSKISLTETESKNKVNEPDLSNESDNINDNDEVFNLVENYNQQADFPDRIEVSETENSKAQRWSGSRKPPIFEINLTNRGEYWIINNQYLVPKPNQKINEHSYKTLSAFFECENYEENAADNMTLVKPAQVSLIDGEEKWQLEKMGSLQF
jgi:hypothetical protein